MSKQRSKKRKSFSVSLKRSKKKDVLRLAPILNDSKASKKVSDSFAWAFFTKKMSYTTELVYDNQRVPK